MILELYIIEEDHFLINYLYYIYIKIKNLDINRLGISVSKK